ncbi:MAG: hypothetical protein RR048_03070, partial [Oscillospiraceae bacterium]
MVLSDNPNDFHETLSPILVSFMIVFVAKTERKPLFYIAYNIRNNRNSEYLAREFEKGAIAAGNETEFVSLIGKDIAFCRGCLACQTAHKC